MRRCFEILDLGPDASMEDARRSYKDMVNVWHPDRFAHNPRLKKKAEQKLKEINTAYGRVTTFMGAEDPGPGSNGAPPASPGKSRDRDLETAVAAGTERVLSACATLYTAFRRWLERDGAQSDQREGGQTGPDINSRPSP
jgi:curved DNA-binding protein CbpA